ncbi:hypothetical protein MRX96_049535 [Rhipicephalus microplus]
MVAGSVHQYPRGSDGDCLRRTASNVVMRTNCGYALRRTRTQRSQGALQHLPPPLTKPRRCQPAWLTPRRRGRRPLANLRQRHRFAGPTGYGDHFKGSTGKRGRCATS